MLKFLHTMLRVSDPAATLAFFALLDINEVRRRDDRQGRYTLIFLAARDDRDRDGGGAEIELTHNWDGGDYPGGRNFGHLAFRVDDIYATCATLLAAGVTINRPPRDGRMAFVRTPDGISLELLGTGTLAPAEPWLSMPNTSSW